MFFIALIRMKLPKLRMAKHNISTWVLMFAMIASHLFGVSASAAEVIHPTVTQVKSTTLSHLETDLSISSFVSALKLNLQRLDSLMATHLVERKLDLHTDRAQMIEISTASGDCFKTKSSENSIEIGPEAVVTKIITTTDSTIYYINRLLWVPYKEEGKCH